MIEEVTGDQDLQMAMGLPENFDDLKKKDKKKLLNKVVKKVKQTLTFDDVKHHVISKDFLILVWKS